MLLQLICFSLYLCMFCVRAFDVSGYWEPFLCAGLFSEDYSPSFSFLLLILLAGLIPRNLERVVPYTTSPHRKWKAAVVRPSISDHYECVGHLESFPQFFFLLLPHLLDYIRYSSIAHLGPFAARLRLYAWLVWLRTLHRDVLAAPVRSVFVFSAVWFLFSSPSSNDLVSPACRVFRVTLSSGYPIGAAVCHKFRRVTCQTFASGYSLLSKCHILVFSCDWTLR